MSRYISVALQRITAERANYRCEYCRLPEIAALVKFHFEHIISLKHGGKTTAANLAYACPICNSNKGSDIGTILEGDEDAFVRFFNPRQHDWFEHFETERGLIFPKTSIGAGTIKILGFNDLDRVMERLELVVAGVYP